MSILGLTAVPHPPLIMPEVGRGEEKKIQATIDAYREVMRRLARLDPELVIVTSPHTVMYADYFHISPGKTAAGSFAAFGVASLKLSLDYDDEFVGHLAKMGEAADFPAGTLGEKDSRLDHATLVPLFFLRDAYKALGLEPRYKVVRIGLAGLSPLYHYRLGKMIARAADDLGQRTVFIASGDLSHKLKADGPYGFDPAGPRFDQACMDALGRGDFLSLLSMERNLAQNAAECGLRSFWIMAGALDKKAVTAEALSYEGTFGVGYGVAYFTPESDDQRRNFGEQFQQREKEKLEKKKSAEDAYVKLARRSVESFVRTGRMGDLPKEIAPEITGRKAAAFVSLKKDGELRGCIGTFHPAYPNLAAEIWANAVAACSEDPRFSPVRLDELASIVYSVDVLSEPEPVTSEDELDAKKYGVIVSAGARRGLLLPDLEGVDTVAEQIAIARRKGGISPEEKVTLQRFMVVRHH